MNTREGSLNTERGFGDDKDATVFILDHDKDAAKQRFFVRYTGEDDVIKALDKDRKELPKQNTLRKVE